MKIIQKLTLGFLVIIALTGILGGISIVSIKKIGAEIKTHLILHDPAKSAIIQVRIDLDKVVRATEEYDADWMTKEESTEEIEEKKERIKKQLVSLFATTKDLAVSEKVKKLEASINEFYDISAELFKVHSKSREEKTLLMKEFDEKVEEVGEKLNVIMDKINKASETSSVSIRDTMGSSYKITILVFAVSILFALGIALVISRNISRRIAKLNDAAEEIRKGKLDIKLEINSKDEIGSLATSFNKMAKDLSVSIQREKELAVVERERAVELERAYGELKQLQEQLIQSAKIASIGQLAGGIAHELNNPLTGVLNNVQLVNMEMERKEGFNREEFKGLLHVIEHSALRCKNVIQAFLNLSHVAKGDFKSLSLNTLIKEVDVVISQEMRLENITFKNELDSVLVDIKGDAQLLEEVILVLVSNSKWAIEKKFQKNPGGIIAIKTHQDPENKNVIMSISDNGIGITQENISRLFKSFFTTKKVGEGTGLGLALIQDIINKHNGDISVESQVNVGTTFKIRLPYV